MRTRVAIIGGGMMGFRLAQRLAPSSDVLVLEAAPSLGGLTTRASFTTPRGDVRWDRFYHVVLSQDTRVQQLLADLGREHTLTLKTVKSELLDATGTVRPMSSVLDLITLGTLPLASRIRVGMTVAAGGLLPAGAGAEDITASRWARKWSGRAASDNLWQPLLRAKLGEYSDIAASTFLRSTYRRLVMARLRGGTGDRFGWLTGGYQPLLDALVEHLTHQGVRFRMDARVVTMERIDDAWSLTLANGDRIVADEVMVTTPGPVAASLLTPHDGVDPQVRRGLESALYLGCVCVSLLISEQVTGGYLTYVTADAPYTGIIEMSNLADRDQFAGYSLLYLPKYVAPDNPLFGRPDDEIGQEFVADLVARYPGLTADAVVAQQTAKVRFVMPVPVAGWESTLPRHATGLPGVYLSSSVQMPHGTLNVESTLGLADTCVQQVLAARQPRRIQ